MHDTAFVRLVVVFTCAVALTAAGAAALWIAEHGLSLRPQHLLLIAPSLLGLTLLMVARLRDDLRKLS